jgi:hypothetical protein
MSDVNPFRIVFSHIFPNIVHLTFLYITMGVASALVMETDIDFLGMEKPRSGPIRSAALIDYGWIGSLCRVVGHCLPIVSYFVRSLECLLNVQYME